MNSPPSNDVGSNKSGNINILIDAKEINDKATAGLEELGDVQITLE